MIYQFLQVRFDLLQIICFHAFFDVLNLLADVATSRSASCLSIGP
jgi:hypothetical protein